MCVVHIWIICTTLRTLSAKRMDASCKQFSQWRSGLFLVSTYTSFWTICASVSKRIAPGPGRLSCWQCVESVSSLWMSGCSHVCLRLSVPQISYVKRQSFALVARGKKQDFLSEAIIWLAQLLFHLCLALSSSDTCNADWFILFNTCCGNWDTHLTSVTCWILF